MRERTAPPARDGGDLQVVGSAGLARDLIAHDLVDEGELVIDPILPGGGKRLFPDDGRARRVTLTSTTTSDTGVPMCTYRRSAGGVSEDG